MSLRGVFGSVLPHRGCPKVSGTPRHQLAPATKMTSWSAAVCFLLLACLAAYSERVCAKLDGEK